MWKLMKGRRSLDGRAWDRFRQGAQGRYKPKDTHDYFVSVAVKWFNDPVATKARFTTEVKHLEGLWERFQSVVQR